ncbi:MAG: VCBS repeat-containing protein, partial [Bacteroidota bacterium]
MKNSTHALAILLSLTLCALGPLSLRGQTFTESATSYNLDLNASKDAGVAWADFDNDGDLDLYVANYLRTNDPLEGGQPNFFYRNEGNLRFTELAAELGLDDEGCGLGATFLDYDNNGTADIYLA